MSKKNSRKPADKNSGKLSGQKKLDLENLYGRVLALVVRHSPSEMTYSKIARLTGVPRPTLYYYFGKSTESLFREALRYGMKRFVLMFEFDRGSEYPDWNSFQKDRLVAAFHFVQRFPWAPALYFKYRNHPGEYGKEIREIEKHYLMRMAEVWQRHNKTKPDEKTLRITAYLKLGVLWGMTSEFDIWFNSETDLVTLAGRMTDMVTDALESSS
jgi:AcrR family transcriptional regulator